LGISRFVCGCGRGGEGREGVGGKREGEGGGEQGQENRGGEANLSGDTNNTQGAVKQRKGLIIKN
jgi:hypothetical protein